MATWHYAINGQRHGPVDESVVRQLLVEGRLRSEDLVWSEGMPQWVQAWQAMHLPAGPPGTMVMMPYAVPGTKSKLAAGLLGIFLGFLGVHNFYLGFWGKGLIQCLLTVISCGTLSFISGIWGLIEGILILTGSIAVDAAGAPLRD